MATDDSPNVLTNASRGLANSRVEPQQRAVGPKELVNLQLQLGPKDGRGSHDPHPFDRKVFLFAKPDGTTYELEFGKGYGDARTPAESWGRLMGHRLLSERPVPRQAAPLTTLEIEPPPKPNQIERSKSEKKERPVKPKTYKTKSLTKTAEPAPPLPPPPTKPKKRSEPIPPPKPEKYTFLDYIEDGSFAKTTFEESLPLAAKWLRRAGKVMEYIPPLKPAAKYYELMAEGLDFGSLVYELTVELKQDEAFEKGSKELVKRVKPVKKIALKLIKRKLDRK